LELGRSQDRPINVVSKRLNEILEEKEYLSQFIEKKYDIEEGKQKLEEEIKEQQINIEVLTKLKKVEDKYELEQEKIRVGENTIREYKRKIEEINFPKKEEIVVRKSKKDNLELIIAIVLILISAISVLLIKNDVISAITIVLAIISTIYAGYTQYKRKLEFHSTKQAQNVDKENKQAQVEIMQATIKNLEREQEELRKNTKKEFDEEIEKIRNSYIGIVPIKTIDELLSKKDARIEIEVANNKIGENKLKIQSIGLDRSSILPKLENLSALEEEYAKLEEEYKNLTFQNEAIELAKQELEQAYYQMKKKVTPSFTTKLSQIMEKISDGKYSNIKLDEKDGLIVEIKNGDYVPIEYLSIGTIDQLYLSLRLSAGTHISNENLPIILDEAFAYYDDERLANILEFLNKEYSNRQIIILTCTNREQNMLKTKNINYNYIEI
jgi:DNA repair exonuclease SbcCD ATPase subunit